MHDFFLFDRFQWRIAARAPGERRERREKIKAPQHLYRLLEWVLRAQTIAVAHNRVHEQAAITRGQSAIVIFGCTQQLSIVRRGIVSHVDPEQAKITDQLSKMTIGDKPIDSCGLQSILWKKRELMSNRINIHLMVALKDAGEIDRLVIDQNQIDFRMRDAAGFNYVLDRGSLGQIPLDNFLTAPAL